MGQGLQYSRFLARMLTQMLTSRSSQILMTQTPSPVPGNTSTRAKRYFASKGSSGRDESIHPGVASPRVRGDKLPATCSFIVDAAGTRQSADELHDEDICQWLWFKPAVISALLDRRGASLDWHTRDTATVSASRVYPVHFGVNRKDLVTAYAYDIARLPEWQQRLWMGFNVCPGRGREPGTPFRADGDGACEDPCSRTILGTGVRGHGLGV